MIVIIPLIIILVIACAVTCLFNYKIEQSNFIVIVSIPIILILFGLIGLLVYGFYLIVLLALVSLIYLIINKFDITKLFTPGIVFYLISTIIFLFLSRGVFTNDFDDMIHWAYSTKCMYFTDTFYRGIQTAFTPTFNYFLTKASFQYSNTLLYAGSWIIIWSSFLLPLGGTDWKDWKKVLIYVIAQYCFIGFIYGSIRMHIDETLAFMSGGLVLFAAFKTQKKLKDYVLIVIGLLAVAQIKDSFGAVFSMMSAIVIIVTELFYCCEKTKKTAIKSILLFMVPIIGYLLSLLTLDKPPGYMDSSALLEMPIIGMLLNSKVYLLLIAVFILLLCIFVVFLKNKKIITIKNYKLSIHKIFGVSLLAILILISYKTVMMYFESLPYNEMLELADGWRDYINHVFGRIPIKYILTLSALAMGLTCSLFIKKEYQRVYIVQTILMIFLYAFAIVSLVLLAHSQGFQESGKYAVSVSWERYIGPPIMAILIFVSGHLIIGNEMYDITPKGRMIMSGIVLAFCLRFIPYPGVVMLGRIEQNRFSPTYLNELVGKDTNIVKQYVDNKNSVYIESCYYLDDVEAFYGEYPLRLLKYEIAPIKSNWFYSKRTNWDYGFVGTIEEYMAVLLEYDYLYIQSAGKPYYDKFGELFPDGMYQGTALYKITAADNGVELEPVYIAEDAKVY